MKFKTFKVTIYEGWYIVWWTIPPSRHVHWLTWNQNGIISIYPIYDLYKMYTKYDSYQKDTVLWLTYNLWMKMYDSCEISHHHEVICTLNGNGRIWGIYVHHMTHILNYTFTFQLYESWIKCCNTVSGSPFRHSLTFTVYQFRAIYRYSKTYGVHDWVDVVKHCYMRWTCKVGKSVCKGTSGIIFVIS